MPYVYSPLHQLCTPQTSGQTILTSTLLSLSITCHRAPRERRTYTVHCTGLWAAYATHSGHHLVHRCVALNVHEVGHVHAAHLCAHGCQAVQSSVCMCVCMCVCMYVCIYVCVCMCVRVRVRSCSACNQLTGQ